MNAIISSLPRVTTDLYHEAEVEETTGLSPTTIALSIMTATVASYAIIRWIANSSQREVETKEAFWRKIASYERTIPQGPVVFQGTVIAKDLRAIQEKMFLESTKMSALFREYIEVKGLKPHTVIDLGCGTGANSIPLLRHGIHVRAIDSMDSLLKSYRSRLPFNPQQRLSLECQDIVSLQSYGPNENADIVLAIDILPYLPPSSWEETMKKIVASLKAGGYLFATLFTKGHFWNHPVVPFHEALGAYYYPINDLPSRLIRHANLEMVECRKREDDFGGYEFVARKPIPKRAPSSFDDRRDGAPLQLVDQKMEEIMKAIFNLGLPPIQRMLRKASYTKIGDRDGSL